MQTTAAKSIAFELLFHYSTPEYQQTLATLLFIYKYMKNTNKNQQLENAKLILFAAYWFAFKNNNMIYGYLFSDYTYIAAFLGLYTAQITLPLNLLLAVGMSLEPHEPPTKILDEVNTYVANTIIYLLGADISNEENPYID